MNDVAHAISHQPLQKQETWKETSGNPYEGFDVEWLLLIHEAKDMGLAPKVVRQFLKSRNKR